ncbi:MAG: hypothetical protein ACXVQQ_06500 [Gaiellaceae bacterium]
MGIQSTPGQTTERRRGRERLHERSQESVVAGIGPVDLSDDGSAY